MGLEQDKQRCLESLTWAIEQLQGKADPGQLSRITELIIQTMTGPWRFFHTPEHIFEVGGADDAIEVLSALFHDLVYVQVDQGVGVNISSYISVFVKEIDGQLTIRDRSELPQDELFELICRIFGFAAGQKLEPTAGQNEFLSAVIAVKTLESMLTRSQLVEIVVCIEATIPFRGQGTDGLSVGDRLYRRLTQTNDQFGLGFTDEHLLHAIRRAIRVANRDVENFASSSSAHFLDNTWNLLPETNHHLKNANAYTVQGYRISIQKMEGFMNFLKPEVVFQQYANEPDDATYREMVERTRKNLDVAKLYLGTKLVSIGIIEALSLRIGRDVPISTMMGELPNANYRTDQLERFLPPIPRRCQPSTDIESDVLDLLEKGRSLDSSYDVKNSPIAAFVVKSIGFNAVRDLLVQAKAFFRGELSPEAFLSSCDPTVVKTVSEGISQLFESRKIALCQPKILSSAIVS